MILETIQILPTSPEQGDFVVINKSDFDPQLHTLYGEHADVSMTKAELQSALDEKGIAHKPAMSKAELQALLNT